MLLANWLRCVVSGPTILVTLGAFPLGWVSASAQTAPPSPAEVPYLNFPRSQLPEKARPRSAPAPATDPSASPAPARPAANLKQREQELEAIRAEQRAVARQRGRLKREIESIGDDRRKLNQQLIDTAARVAASRTASPRPRSGSSRSMNASRRCASRSRNAASDRRGAGGPAADRPPAAARAPGQAEDALQVGARGDDAGRGAAGDAAGDRSAHRRSRRIGAAAHRASPRNAPASSANSRRSPTTASA